MVDSIQRVNTLDHHNPDRAQIDAHPHAHTPSSAGGGTRSRAARHDSLLVVIRNEAVLLGGVRDDVQFIQEEMESMNSFLAHLARSAPPGSEHDEQVRTWMNQVRLLAQDCNGCIDLYLYRGNPDIHRAKGRLRRYLWWLYWSLHKLLAQHRAAVQLRQLKDRARDVGERRLRYGVEVPAKSAAAAGLMLPASSSSSVNAAAAAPGDDEEEESEEDELVVAPRSGGRSLLFEPPTLDDHVKAKLLKWFDEIPPNAGKTYSIAIMVSDTYYHEALALARDTLVVPPTFQRAGYHRDILVNIPASHPDILPLRPKEVLYYILRELKDAKSRSLIMQVEGGDKEDKEEDLDSWQDYYKKFSIYLEKKRELGKIKRNIKKMMIYEKLDKIKSEIQVQQQKGEGARQQLLRLDLGQNKSVDRLDLHVLLLLLHESATADASQQDPVKNKDMRNLPAWDDSIILKIAKKLKKHMEAAEKSREFNGQMGEEKEEIAKQEAGGEEWEEEKRKEMENREDDSKEEPNKEMENRGEDDSKMEEEQNKEMENRAQKTSEEEQKKDNNKERSGEMEEADSKEDEQLEHMEKEVGEEDDDEDYDDDDDTDEEEDEEEEEEGGEEEEEEEGGEEDEDEEGPICLHEDQYAQILREVFPKTSNSKPLQAQQKDGSATTTALDEERIKEMIQEAKQEVLRELQGGNPDKNLAAGKPGVLGQNQKADFDEIVQKIEKSKQKLKEQLKINRIVDKIKHHLKGDCPLIILKVDDMMDGSGWEDIRQALSLLECSADAVIFTTTKSTQRAKGYYYPPREPIDYSLVGLYHDKVLELTSQQKEEDSPSPKVFRDILEECQPHEFCMKIFSHALYANPKRSNEELKKLHSTLKDSPKSFNILAKKMFMYSYNDLPKEYKSCLLYLAIFPKGKTIRRSTLIGRWVVEGLTLKEDWTSSVLHAHRCFDALIHRWFVYPADIGATGKIKSCVVSDLVHGFITTIARKQHIVETRLSHHLARHFSIFNNLQLRSSDRIDKFFQGLSKSSRISMLKVLDLEDCQCFGGKNQRYLKDICSKMLLLKYLSLKGTDITYLPSEINYLRDLEILDIRQTKVPEDATANILLLKLKRLLAGDPTPDNFDTSVRVPHRIDKMVNIEILYNVKAKHRDDLKDIGKLWQLRKLGVVIEDKGSHLRHLLRTISDLHECLLSLSITLPVAAPHGGTPSTGSRLHECLRSRSNTLPVAEPHGGTPSTAELPEDISSHLQHHPKILESLSISGTTLHGHLLPLFKRGDNNTLAKVTLSRTQLDEKDLDVLAELPRLRCVRLKHIVCTEPMLTFKQGKFSCLKCLLVEGSNLTNITFEEEAAPELEKMVLSFTSTGSVSGVDMLPKLEELELKNSFSGRLLSSFNDAKQIAKLTLCGTLLEQDALRILSKKPNMRCLVLLGKSFDERQNQITFNKDEFIWLNLLVVDCSTITKIVFATGSAPRLEKIVRSSFTSLSGINNLPRLKELEFNGDLVPNEVEEVIKNNKDKVKIKHNKPETQHQAKGDEQEYDEDAGIFSLCWK